MKVRIAILAAAVALAYAAPVQAQASSDQAGALRHPSATVRTPINVSVDSAVGINADVVSWLIGQPEVLLAAARELDPDAKPMSSVGAIHTSVEGHALPCQVELRFSEIRELNGRTTLAGNIEMVLGPTAEEVPLKDREQVISSLRQFGQRLTQALASRLEKPLSQIEAKQFEATRRRADRVASQAAQLGRKMRDDSLDTIAKLSSHGLGSQPEAVLVQSIGDLTKQKLELELERAGLQARAQVLEEQTRTAAKRAEEASQADEIVQNYQKVVELQRQRQQSLKAAHQAGHLGPQELSQGEIELATATVELAKAQRAAAHPRIQELERLSGELASSAVRSAECESKLKYVAEQLEKALANWHTETSVGTKLREELKDLQKRAELFEDENRRSQVESFLLPYGGDAHVEIFSNPQEK